MYFFLLLAATPTTRFNPDRYRIYCRSAERASKSDWSRSVWANSIFVRTRYASRFNIVKTGESATEDGQVHARQL